MSTLRKHIPQFRVTRMACPICVAGSLDQKTKNREYIFVELDDYMDSGGNLPERRVSVTGHTWQSFSLFGLSLILIWK